MQTFVLGRKAIFAAEAYVLGLFQLYPTVYLHKATRGAEKIYVELLARAFTLVKKGLIGKTGTTCHAPPREICSIAREHRMRACARRYRHLGCSLAHG